MFDGRMEVASIFSLVIVDEVGEGSLTLYHTVTSYHEVHSNWESIMAIQTMGDRFTAIYSYVL